MPVQVNEMVIRASVHEHPLAAQINPIHQSATGEEEKAAMIAECVEQVMEILKREQIR